MESRNNEQQGYRPCFAVDIDNVLARAEAEVQRLYLELTGTTWPRGMYGSAGGLDDERLPTEIVEEIFIRFHEKSIPHLPLLPSARVALMYLQHRYRIVIVTARRPSSRTQTLAWLHAHHLPFDALYHTEDKTEVEEPIALAVDDHPVHAYGYCQMGVRVFLMDQPWNRKISHPLMTRVQGWDDLLQTLDYGTIPSWPSEQSEYPSLKNLLHQDKHVMVELVREA